jgi:hypothetical protein
MMMPADQIARLESVVREQMTEIDRLRAVIKQRDVGLGQLQTENRRLQDWIMGDEPDALATLQRIYSDPNTPLSEQIKSSGLAMPFERSKPVTTTVVVNFNERLRTIRLAQLAKDKARWAAEDAAKVIEHQPLDLDAPTPPTVLGGEGPDPAA